MFKAEKEKMWISQNTELGYNELMTIQPDYWKNIPQPIIGALKMVIDSLTKTHKKLFDTQILVEENAQRNVASAKQNDIKQTKLAERLDGSIRAECRNNDRKNNEIREDIMNGIVNVKNNLDETKLLQQKSF